MSLITDRRKLWVAVGLLLISFLGLMDASYLTLEHFRGGTPECSLTGGCETVTTSSYSEVLGVPVALFGALYYLMMLFGAVVVLDRRDERVLIWLARATVLGLLASIYFTLLQAFVIEAWCQYCLASALSSTLLFLIGYGYLVLERKKYV